MSEVRGDSGAAWRLEPTPAHRGPHALVYRAIGEDGLPAALKLARLPGRDGAWVEDEATELRVWGEHTEVGRYLAPIWDTGRWEGRWFHVTSWYPASLQERTAASPEERRGLARALVDAVLACRAWGFTHPNLHLRNVFLDDGHLFLADAGTRPLLRPAWSTAAIVPSTSLTAPEQFVGLLPSDDVFALAACVFELLVGHPPEAPLENVLRLTPRGRRWAAGLEEPGALEEVVDLRRCRPLTAGDRQALAGVASAELVGALERLLDPDPTRRGRDPALLPPLLAPPRAPGRRAAPAALAAGGLVLAGATAILLAADPPAPVSPPVSAPSYELVRVPAGAFWMGSPEGEPDRSGDEALHRVVLTRDFLIGAREVTQAEWEAVMGANPAATARRHWGGAVGAVCATYDGQSLVGADLPVLCVSWRDAVRFANRWSVQAGLQPAYTIDRGGEVRWDREADGYRLPTEAEWEHAARAGGTGPFPGAADEAEACRVANVRAGACDDGAPGLLPVGSLAPNAWGLFDMLGNVQEWTWDVYAPYPDEATDPTGPDAEGMRVNRGGSWFRAPRRVAWRSADADEVRAPTVGLRLARNAP